MRSSIIAAIAAIAFATSVSPVAALAATYPPIPPGPIVVGGHTPTGHHGYQWDDVHKRCPHGKPCGSGCIAKDKVCRQDTRDPQSGLPTGQRHDRAVRDPTHH
jgi:hypothetical protein